MDRRPDAHPKAADGPGQRVPEWLVERAALGELAPDRLADVKARLAREPDGAARLAALDASNQEVLAALPPSDVAREVQRRFESQARIDSARAARRRQGFLVFMPFLAATAALAIYVRPAPIDVDPAAGVEGPGELRSKGTEGPKLFVYREGKGEPELLADGSTARAGDTLQLRYAATGLPYGVVLSIDGRGNVTLHHPAQVGESTALVKEGTATIARAYQLDDAPEFERFFLVASQRPLDVREVVSAAERAARTPASLQGTSKLAIAADRQASVLVRKAP